MLDLILGGGSERQKQLSDLEWLRKEQERYRKRVRKRGSTTIRIKHYTKAMLEDMKELYGVGSFDAVIWRMYKDVMKGSGPRLEETLIKVGKELLSSFLSGSLEVEEVSRSEGQEVELDW